MRRLLTTILLDGTKDKNTLYGICGALLVIVFSILWRVYIIKTHYPKGQGFHVKSQHKMLEMLTKSEIIKKSLAKLGLTREKVAYVRLLKRELEDGLWVCEVEYFGFSPK